MNKTVNMKYFHSEKVNCLLIKRIFQINRVFEFLNNFLSELNTLQSFCLFSIP